MPAAEPNFLDLRSITSGWECTRRGIAVIARNPCDPTHRPANYPHIWMWFAWMGLGQGATVILGVALAVVFFAAVLALVGRSASVTEGIVWCVAVLSAAVMLGVERGNADLFVFAVLVGGVLLFRSRRAIGRAIAHALIWAAAVLKLFPVFAFALLLRQSRRWVVIGGGLVVVAFTIYALSTLSDIRTIQQVLPQATYYSYGADVGVRAGTLWLAVHDSSRFSWLEQRANEHLVLLGFIALAVVIAVLVGWRWRVPQTGDVWRLDAWIVGASIYLGTFVLEHNFDYRLVFLLFLIPQLVRWAPHSRLANLTLATALTTLWLSEWLSNGYWEQHYPLPYDELANWLLFVCLGAMAVALIRGCLGGLIGVRAYSGSTSRSQ